jgi:hypothetical protein
MNINNIFSKQFVFNNDNSDKTETIKDIEIKTVTSLKGFKDFYHVPRIIYKNDKNWITPFWTEYKEFFYKKNPFWSHASTKLFVAYRNNEIVGRIASFVDELYCKSQKKNIGFFGFFECINDYDSAAALFNCAEKWLFLNKMDLMQGPIDGRIDVGCGFLRNRYDLTPCLLSSYTPKYYLSFVKKYGMEKLRDLFLYYIDLTKPIPDKLKEKAKQCESSGIKVRQFNRLHANREIKWWVELFMQTFKDHWGFVPVTPDEVKTRFGIKQIRWFIDSKLFLIAEVNGKPIAYIWSTPDYNQIFKRFNGKLGLLQIFQFILMKNKINSGKLPLIGIKKEFRNKNIGSFLNYITLVEMKNRGYIGAEVGWIDEKNTIAHSTISITGARLYKKLGVFEKKISNN